MRYEIKGGMMPVVEIILEAGESINCEKGAMVWMSPNMQMQTSGGGVGKMFTRAISGESMFRNTYTAQGGPGLIAFGSSFVGNIMAVEIGPGKEIICQKSAYLASTPGINLEIAFQKKIAGGFFGGEGFIMQRITGQGIVFLEIDGSVVDYMLAPGYPFPDSIPCLCPHSSVYMRYRNFNLLSIDYVFRPRLRSRLTQSRSALLWKP